MHLSANEGELNEFMPGRDGSCRRKGTALHGFCSLFKIQFVIQADSNHNLS